jgi:hypothetical protein
MGKIIQAFDIVSIDEPWLSPTMFGIIHDFFIGRLLGDFNHGIS